MEELNDIYLRSKAIVEGSMEEVTANSSLESVFLSLANDGE